MRESDGQRGREREREREREIERERERERASERERERGGKPPKVTFMSLLSHFQFCEVRGFQGFPGITRFA